MCALAGRKADGAIVMGPAQPDMVRRQVGWIEAGLEEAGRTRSDFDISFMATTAANVDDVRSWASTQARLLTHYKELPESLLPFRDEIKLSAASYDLTRALAVVGTSIECSARLREIWSTGVDTLMFPLAGRNRVERWRTIRDEILAQIIV